jgi:DME family drug/metabolite transporter
MLPRLYVLAAAVLWSTAGAAIKRCALSGWQISAGRSIVAGIFLFAAFRDARRRPTLATALVALAYAGTVVLFVLANKLTTAANAIFIQDAAPLYVLLLSPWLLGERPTRAELLAVPVYVAGIALFFADRLSPGRTRGNLVALASGVAFALCIMGLRRVRDEGGMPATAWGNLVAFAICAPFSGGPVPAAGDLGIVLFLGVFQLGLAYVSFSHGLKHVPAVEASLLILLEPVLGAGETPGPLAVTGGVVILAATVWRTVGAGRGARRESRAVRVAAEP